MTVLGYFNSLRELGGARRIPEALFGFVGSGLHQRARGAELHRAFHRGFVCVCGTAMAATAVTGRRGRRSRFGPNPPDPLE